MSTDAPATRDGVGDGPVHRPSVERDVARFRSQLDHQLQRALFAGSLRERTEARHAMRAIERRLLTSIQQL